VVALSCRQHNRVLLRNQQRAAVCSFATLASRTLLTAYQRTCWLPIRGLARTWGRQLHGHFWECSGDSGRRIAGRVRRDELPVRVSLVKTAMMGNLLRPGPRGCRLLKAQCRSLFCCELGIGCCRAAAARLVSVDCGPALDDIRRSASSAHRLDTTVARGVDATHTRTRRRAHVSETSLPVSLRNMPRADRQADIPASGQRLWTTTSGLLMMSGKKDPGLLPHSTVSASPILGLCLLRPISSKPALPN